MHRANQSRSIGFKSDSAVRGCFDIPANGVSLHYNADRLFRLPLFTRLANCLSSGGIPMLYRPDYKSLFANNVDVAGMQHRQGIGVLLGT